MLQKLSAVTCVDNTTVRGGKIIHIYGGCGRKVYATSGNYIRISVRSVKRLSGRFLHVKLKKKRRITFKSRRRRTRLVRVKRTAQYPDGCTLNFRDNGIIMYKRRRTFKGKRFRGFVSRTVGFKKVLHKFKIQL